MAEKGVDCGRLGTPGERRLFGSLGQIPPAVLQFPSSLTRPSAQLPLGDAVEPGFTAPLRVDPPDVDIRRAVAPAAWIWYGTGAPAQGGPASGEQHRQAERGHRREQHLRAPV